MSNGRFLQYYWQIRTLLGEKEHLLDRVHPDYQICGDDDVEYRSTFRATIVFADGSRLTVRFALKGDGDIVEFNYAYQYLDPHGKRIFRYDDAPHHPEIVTHPHHLHRGPEPSRGKKDKVYPLDILRVDFATVFTKIERQYLKGAKCET